MTYNPLVNNKVSEISLKPTEEGIDEKTLVNKLSRLLFPGLKDEIKRKELKLGKKEESMRVGSP